MKLSQLWRTAIRAALVLLAAVSLSLSPSADAKGSKGASAGFHKAQGVARDSHGKIARSASAKGSFRKQSPCPSTGRISGACPGYVIDHVTPLKRGGADAPGNMQWQTKAEAREKDRWE